MMFAVHKEIFVILWMLNSNRIFGTSWRATASKNKKEILCNCECSVIIFFFVFNSPESGWRTSAAHKYALQFFLFVPVCGCCKIMIRCRRISYIIWRFITTDERAEWRRTHSQPTILHNTCIILHTLPRPNVLLATVRQKMPFCTISN